MVLASVDCHHLHSQLYQRTTCAITKKIIELELLLNANITKQYFVYVYYTSKETNGDVYLKKTVSYAIRANEQRCIMAHAGEELHVYYFCCKYYSYVGREIRVMCTIMPK